MANRIVHIAAILVCLSFPCIVRPEDNPSPRNLLGFMSPGMRIGVQSVEGTTNVFVDIYTEEQFAIANDLAIRAGRFGRFISAKEIVDAHPAISEQLDLYVKQLKRQSPEANADDVDVIPLFRRIFGTVSAVGDDYVMIDRGGKTKRRLVLSRSAIARIELDAKAVHFNYPRNRRR
jgi:hypothetical protein